MCGCFCYDNFEILMSFFASLVKALCGTSMFLQRMEKFQWSEKRAYIHHSA